MKSEDSPLLPLVKYSARKSSNTCCLRSKAVLLILLWNFSILQMYKFFYDTNAHLQIGAASQVYIVIACVLAVFSPVAGLLTDIKFSRFKAVLCSSYSVSVQILVFFLAMIAAISAWKYSSGLEFTRYRDRIRSTILVGTVLLIMVTVYMVFLINAFQFGIDQLHDSPTEYFILYIHWYVWIYYVCSLLAEFIWKLTLYDLFYFEYIDGLRIAGISLTVLIFIITLVLLTLSHCIVKNKKVWFVFEPAGVNPYKLVYRVVKFAYQHKIPLRRSAFTYCDEESQTRLDVGKHKYGGPFTTKQVEDVKAFWGILKVLISIGPAFLLQNVMQIILPAFSKHGNVFLNKSNHHPHEVHLEGVARYMLISNGLLSPLLVVICIPLYLCLIRSHVTYCIPGMLKRIQLAIVVMIIALISTLVFDVIVHVKNTEYSNCMLRGYLLNHLDLNQVNASYFPSSLPLYQNVYFFTSHHVLSALADMLFDIAVLEFICSQSPYSMKGLLLGICFSIRSLFEGVTLFSAFPFITWPWEIESPSKLSCGSAFYAMIIIIGLLEFVLFSCVSKRYKYREVNEPCNEYRYAEEYYSNIQ